MTATQNVQERLDKLENEVQNLVMLEQATERKCLCSKYHKNEGPSGSQHVTSSCVRSCPNWEQYVHCHSFAQTGGVIKCKKKQRSCECSKDLKRPFSTPVTPIKCESSYPKKCSVTFGIDCHKHIESSKKKNADKDITAVSSKALNLRNKPSSSVNVIKACSCPVRKCSCSSKSATSNSSKQIIGYGEVADLKNEVSKIKTELREMQSSKKEALDVTSQLHNRFNRLGEQKSRLEKEISKLKSENERLSQELKKSCKCQALSADETVKAQNLLSAYREQASSFHVKAEKNSQVIEATKEKFCKCLKAKDEHVLQLKKKNRELSKNLETKEADYNELCKEFNCLKEQMSGEDSKVDQLKKANQKFCECLSDLESQLQEALKEAEKGKDDLVNYQAEVENLRAELNRKCICDEESKLEKKKFEEQVDQCICREVEMKKIIDTMSQRIAELEEKNKSIRPCGDECETLRTKLSLIEMEMKNISPCGEECQKVKEKLKLLMDEKENTTPCGEECKKLRLDYKNLNQKYDELLGKLQEFRHEDKQRAVICSNAKDKEAALMRERDELKRLVDELNQVVKENKENIYQLTETINEQEKILNVKNKSDISKNNQIKGMEKELSRLQQQNQEKEKQLKCLQEYVKKLNSENAFNKINEDKDDCDCLKKELEKTKALLEAEKENKLVQQKILDNQSATICSLQHKLKTKSKEIENIQNSSFGTIDEVKGLKHDLLKVQSECAKDASEKDRLQDELQKVETQKDHLAFKVTELEKIVNCYCNNEEENISKQQQLIFTLEEQLQLERREADVQKQLMGKEKEKAVHAARFATQKLLETVEDFQKQIDMHKDVQKMLTNLLREKEGELRSVKCKMKSISDITQDVQVKGKQQSNAEYKKSNQKERCVCPKDT